MTWKTAVVDLTAGDQTVDIVLTASPTAHTLSGTVTAGAWPK